MDNSPDSDLLTEQQNQVIQTLNDRYGVKEWRFTKSHTIVVEMDDGDLATVTPMGNWSMI